MEMKLVKEISMKTFGFSAKEIRKLVEGKEEMVPLARIGGVVLEKFSGVSKHGEWTAFKGVFSAATYDGRAFQAKSAFLPARITKQIEERLAAGEYQIHFTADVFATASDKNASGYAFVCEPAPSEEDMARSARIADLVMQGIAAPAPQLKLSAGRAKK